jgi:hypothetical protein
MHNVTSVVNLGYLGRFFGFWLVELHFKKVALARLSKLVRCLILLLFFVGIQN